MTSRIPSSFRKYVVTNLTTKFREAVKIVTVQSSEIQPGPKEVLVKNRYVGINASDINWSSGRYDPTAKPPFNIGFEGVGEVVATGTACKRVKIGQPVAYIYHGAFAEYHVIPEHFTIPVPSVKAEYVPLLVSGMTATICLDKVGEIKKGETVLITAAAGGTGQFAVQWAKLAGCHVIGTCSSEEKVAFLKSLGCDRVINYTQEAVKDVLRKEYKKGVDVVYESVGGEMFDTCVGALAQKGRLVVIGSIAGYEGPLGFAPTRTPALPMQMLVKSASVRGFFLDHFSSHYKEYLPKVIQMVSEGKLQSAVDLGQRSEHGPFKGLESVPNAVDYLYTKRSVGKIVVDMDSGASSQL